MNFFYELTNPLARSDTELGIESVFSVCSKMISFLASFFPKKEDPSFLLF